MTGTNESAACGVVGHERTGEANPISNPQARSSPLAFLSCLYSQPPSLSLAFSFTLLASHSRSHFRHVQVHLRRRGGRRRRATCLRIPQSALMTNS